MNATSAQPLIRGPVRGLEDVIANRRWVCRQDPFPHIVARNVFTEDAYRAFVTGFEHALATYFAKNPDSFTMKMSDDRNSPFAMFTSRAWHDMLATLWGIDATGDVDGGLHHHEPGGKGGHVHNDLNPGWFVGAARSDRVNLPRPAICSYYHGDVAREGVAPRRTVRAVAMLYYLNNPPWRPGDGGETGLYRANDDGVLSPVAVVPPINNSMLLFECTPHSYHSFIASKNARNSIIMWLHRPYADAVGRWGEEAIVAWPRKR